VKVRSYTILVDRLTLGWADRGFAQPCTTALALLLSLLSKRQTSTHYMIQRSLHLPGLSLVLYIDRNKDPTDRVFL